ncbi:hypothetical protein BGZ81_009109 [Podila clonocystis]|nr:hypothetical protein BGZ81_009109 [Podila clonocystis]
MESTLKDLQEFLATSKDLLGVVDDIPLASASSRLQKNTSESTVVYVACPINPKNHSRIPQSSLEKHLKKCKNGKETSPGHIGYKPATRLKPVPDSRSFYRNITNPVVTTIVYKDKLSARQQKLLLSKGLTEDVSKSAGALKDAGLYHLHGSQAFLYDPPGSAPTSSTPMDLRSSKEKSQAYSEHIRLQDLIKQTKAHEGEPSTSSSTNVRRKDQPFARSQVMERVDQIRKRHDLEKKAEREIAQKKLQWDLKKRRQGYKSESARANKKKRYASDAAGQAIEGRGKEEESEAIRKALAKGKSGAWAAAIEVFMRDAQLVATAESELQEEFEKHRRGIYSGDVEEGDDKDASIGGNLFLPRLWS